MNLKQSNISKELISACSFLQSRTTEPSVVLLGCINERVATSEELYKKMLDTQQYILEDYMEGSKDNGREYIRHQNTLDVMKKLHSNNKMGRPRKDE